MSSNAVCPSCGAQDTSPFYEILNVPVNNCLLLETEQQALNFPTGDVALRFCKKCGFIYNNDYDLSKVDYSSVYEDQQCFSQTFNNFAQNLAESLVAKHFLHNKKVLEIGCGKGDFLALLCNLGSNIGVGIDPAYVQNRIQTKDLKRLTFIRDFYSEKYSGYTGDFLCCRHTLEHIPNTGEFVNTIRRSIGNKLDTIVFFEIPDVRRVLKECAFWDVYYEHCSYFSLGSIARLFRLCRFEILDLYKGFNDQYLLIEAKPVNKPSEKIHELEGSVEDLEVDVNFFARSCNEKLINWKKLLREMCLAEKRVAVWGSSSKCVSFFTTLGLTDEIQCVVDINPFRHGKFLPGAGKKVMPPNVLIDYKPDVVIVMNPIYCDEIRQMLNKMGLNPELLSV